MARLHGKRGLVMLALRPGENAQTLAFMSNWEIDFVPTYFDVTPVAGAVNRLWTAGIEDVSGTFTGFYDDATVQAYKAAVDGVPRSFYLYQNDLANFWSGSVLVGTFDVSAGIADAVKVSCAWVASSTIEPGVGSAGGVIASPAAAAVGAAAMMPTTNRPQAQAAAVAAAAPPATGQGSAVRAPAIAAAVSAAAPAAGANIGAVVRQTKQGSAAALSLTLTLDSPTLGGTGLAVMVASAAPGDAAPVVSGMTIGGAASNFARFATYGDPSNDWSTLDLWTCPNAPSGQTVIVVTFGGTAASPSVMGSALEITGLFTSGVNDKSAGAVGTASGAFSSGATATLSQVNEVAIGAVGAGGPNFPTLVGPGGAWTSLPQVTAASGRALLTAYDVVSAVTPVTFSGTGAPANGWAAMVGTLKSHAAGPWTAGVPVASAVANDATVTAVGGGGGGNNWMANPSAHGYPDATNTGAILGALTNLQTGVPASGSGWSWDGSSLTISGNSVTFQNYSVPGQMFVNGTNCTVKNCKVVASAFNGNGITVGGAGYLIDHCTVQGTNDTTSGLDAGIKGQGGNNVSGTIQWCNIFNSRSGIQDTAGLVDSNYIHQLRHASGDHINGLTRNGGTQALKIRHNTIICAFNQTDCVGIFGDFGQEGNDTIGGTNPGDGNLLAGGGYSIYGGNSAPGGNPINVKIQNNRISDLVWPNGGFWGWLAATGTGNGNVVSGNIWDPDGSLL